MWDSLPEIMPYESMRYGIILDYLGLEFSGLRFRQYMAPSE